jgi:excinuclease ABC subunit A
VELIVPDDSISIKKGGIAPLGDLKGNRTMRIIEALLTASGDTLKTAIRDLDDRVLSEILYGTEGSIYLPGKGRYKGRACAMGGRYRDH